MNKLSRGPLGDNTYHYQISRLSGFREEDFLMFSYITLCKTYKPWGGAIFGPGVIILTNLVEDHKVKLHTKYERSSLVVTDKNIFKDFPMIKHISPGVWPFLARGSKFEQTK